MTKHWSVFGLVSCKALADAFALLGLDSRWLRFVMLVRSYFESMASTGHPGAEGMAQLANLPRGLRSDIAFHLHGEVRSLFGPAQSTVRPRADLDHYASGLYIVWTTHHPATD